MRVTGMRLAGWSAAVLLSVVNLASAPDEAPLAEAAKNRDQGTVRALLHQEADVNAAMSDGATALHWATHWDDFDMAMLLIEAGAQVNASTDYGMTPLALASTNGSATLVAILLEAGADPNTALPTGETALMIAARTGRVEPVTLLLDSGAAVDAQESSRGQTPLMWAAGSGHPKIVRLLIERGANPRAHSMSFTPLLFAARSADIETTEVLLGTGVDVNEAGSGGTTALYVAISGGNIPYAEFLLERGADPNGGPGMTALHLVASGGAGDVRAEHGELGGAATLELARRLMTHGADPNARAIRARGVGTDGATPFFWAAKMGDVSLMRLLAQAGADPVLATFDETTPLMSAAGIGSPAEGLVPEGAALEAVRLCVELGNDVNAVNANGETALHGVAYRGPEGGASIAELLMVEGANLNVKNARGWTPLLISEGLYFAATNTTNPGVRELLREAGAAPSPPGYDRNTGMRSGEQWYPAGMEPSLEGIRRPAADR